MILYDSTGKPHVIGPSDPEPPELPTSLYRVQGFDVWLEARPEEMIIAPWWTCPESPPQQTRGLKRST